MADLPWYVSLTLFLVGIVVLFLLLAYNRSIGRFYVSYCRKWEERQERRAAARKPPSQKPPRRPFSMTPPPDVSFGTAGLDNVNLTQDVEAQTASQTSLHAVGVSGARRSRFHQPLHLKVSLSICRTGRWARLEDGCSILLLLK
jgi:hypothetical protein